MIETVGNIRIKVNKIVWVLSHEYQGMMGTKFDGIDGVFDTLQTVLNAKKICEEDKPSWHFIITEQKLINDIWKIND